MHKAGRISNWRSGNRRAAGGYVYVLTNPAMPGLVKIGRTGRDPLARLAEINSATGVPVPFAIAGAVRAADPAAVERDIHSRLTSCRVNRKREFFRCPAEKALAEAKSSAQRHGSKFLPGRRVRSVARRSRPLPPFTSGLLASAAGLSWAWSYDGTLSVALGVACAYCLVTGRPKHLAEALGLPVAFGPVGYMATILTAAAPAAMDANWRELAVAAGLHRLF